MFETDKEVLDWYERQPRALSKEYVNNIRWKEIKNYPINPAFVPVLIYMRDIEYFTDMYYQELRRTPTGKDPIIRKFMDRWSIEELHHANLLNRFLEEAGYPSGDNWRHEATGKIPKMYTVGSFLINHATRPFGKYFHGAHMVWGAINEITAMQAYRRLSELAGHPVLKELLVGIVQEESIHGSFYWNVARVKLAEKKFSRDLARFIIGKFWSPVGAGAKRESDANYVMATLFPGKDGLELFDRKIGNRIERLPGFFGFKGLTERIAPIVQGKSELTVNATP
ncbi:MAG TPA: ferritin-like domain-containing protein [Pyrinomonadaceae bacterium]|nr:ferritin-like domain-containing protein [Pyrinomonadaceae bacterium]